MADRAVPLVQITDPQTRFFVSVNGTDYEVMARYELTLEQQGQLLIAKNLINESEEIIRSGATDVSGRPDSSVADEEKLKRTRTLVDQVLAFVFVATPPANLTDMNKAKIVKAVAGLVEERVVPEVDES